MSTNTARITALESTQREQGEALGRIESMLSALVASHNPASPAIVREAAHEAEIEAHVADRAAKTLTRSAWQTLRRTKGGVVRKAFAGLTREQAFEAGLCEGFVLPTGELRRSLKAA